MWKSLKKQLATLITSCVVLSACAAPEGQPDVADDLDLRGSDCILIATIRDYTPLSRDTLLIHAAAKRSYLVRLTAPGFGADMSFRLATRSRDDQLCPYGGDSIVVDTWPGGEARIQSISRVTPEQVEELLVRYGKKEPGDTENPSPAKVNGADVEELG